MGVEHSLGHQTLCYINAEHEEECFRSEFENHNLFEMGFDMLQKDTALMEGLEQYAKSQRRTGELEEDRAAAIEEYMS